MVQHEINLRSAAPTLDEGLVFAHHLNEASEGFFHFMLGQHAEKIISTAFVQPDHDLSYQYVTFAECNNIIVGMVSGYTAEQHRRSSLQPLKRAAGKRNLRMRLILILFAPLMRIIDSIDDGDFYIQAIAIDKELRGSGIGSTLMDFAEEQARKSGSARLSLDVSANNKGACQFYKHRGMSIESRWPKHFPLPGLSFYRMVKTL